MKRARENALKIGKTSRTPEERAEELSASTGVSTPYVVVHSREVKNMDECEKKVHKKLFKYRFRKEFFDIDVKTAIEVVDEVCEVDSIFLSVNEYDKLPLHEKLELDCLYIKTIATKELDIYGNQKQLSEPYVKRENIRLISRECIEWSLDKMEKEKYLIVSYDSLILIENKKRAFDLIKNQRTPLFLYVERFAPKGNPPSDLAYSLIDRFVDNENKCLDELNEKMDLAFNNYLSELTQKFKMVYLKDEEADNPFHM